jgi:bacteriocin biosynthesis cyclodehydratase domain-containing protein
MVCYRSALMTYPRLRDHLSAEVIRPNLALIFSDVEHWVLEGPVYPRLLPLLDGTRSVTAILNEMRGYNVAEVRAALLILEQSGYVTDADQTTGTPTVSSASVYPKPDSEAAPVRRILETFGYKLDPNGEIVVLITDEYLRREVADFAVHAAHTNRGWLPVKPAGTIVWLGPIVFPPLTPCWNCLLHRLRANRPAHAWLESRGKLLPSRGEGPLKTSALRVAIGHSPTPKTSQSGATACHGSETLLTIDPLTWRYSKHVVIRQPSCPLCWNPDRARGRHDTPPDPAGSRKRRHAPSRTDGGWRTVSAKQTFRNYRHHISKVTGIVSELQRRSIGGQFLELYTATHLFAPSHESPFGSGRRTSAGKGTSGEQARTSALCEALERFSGVFRGDEPRIRASYRALGDRAIHPNVCAHFSDAQFDSRETWNARAAPEAWIPRRLDRNHAIEWTPVRSLSTETVRYVPTAYCYYGYHDGSSDSPCRGDSNGCAAGNTVHEAILHGFLELVERDGVAIWWYNELVRPAVDLLTFAHPYFRAMLEDYERVGRSLAVLDLTTDLGIPVFAAVSESAKPSRQPLLLGFGAHLDAQTAISRALTELNQWRCGLALGDVDPCFSDAPGRPGEFLRATPSTAMRRSEDFAPARDADIYDAVHACVDRASRLGLETFVLDQTREDVGLKVVRVIVPGLRHFWPRFGPGRLYTVPVELGWTRSCRTEQQLNNFHLLV